MAGLAVATVVRRDAGEVVIVNRSPERAERLALEYGGRAAPMSALATEIAEADLVVACAGAPGLLVTHDMVRSGGRALAVVDLALPHDVDPRVADLPGVSLVTLADLVDELRDSEAGAEVDAVRTIVAAEVESFLSARRQAGMTPTVIALRTMATGVVESELARLEARLPELDDATRAEIRKALHRVTDKLVHQPTIRAKELGDRSAVSYATALAELFALDPDAVDAVTRPRQEHTLDAEEDAR